MINVVRSGFAKFKWLPFAASCLLVILSVEPLSCESLASEFGENFPCFLCEANRADIIAHNVPSWTTCVPAYFHLVWDLTEKRTRNDWHIGPSSEMNLVLEEDYTGCLEITYQTESMEQIFFAKMVGPCPVSSASRKIKQISAQFGLSRPSRKRFSGPDEFSTTQTTRPNDFSIEPHFHGEKSLIHDCTPLAKVNSGSIYMPRILPKKELIAPDTWKLIERRYPWGRFVDVSLDKLLTCDDFVRAIRSKTSIIKTLPFSFHREPRSYLLPLEPAESTVGNVTVNISFLTCSGDKNNTAGSVAFSGSCTEDGGIVLRRRGSVFVNGKPIARAGDRVFSTFDGVVEIAGKQDWKVFAEGKPVARVGDVTTKGVKIIGGSKDTFMGQ